MKDLLVYILENMVPEANATVDEKEEDGQVILTITAPKEYIGKIIGKGGKTINSIKNVVKIRAIRENKHVEIEVTEAE